MDITTSQHFWSVVVPLFGQNVEKLLEQQTENRQYIVQELSVFDVKELYDHAYAEKDKGPQFYNGFRQLLAKAVKLDMEYRRQLRAQQRAKNAPATHEEKDKNATGKSQVA
jgi:hypothetical protein